MLGERAALDRRDREAHEGTGFHQGRDVATDPLAAVARKL